MIIREKLACHCIDRNNQLMFFTLTVMELVLVLVLYSVSPYSVSPFFPSIYFIISDWRSSPTPMISFLKVMEPHTEIS